MSTSTSTLDTKRGETGDDYVGSIAGAASSGKGPMSLIREVASLSFGRGKLKPDEYFLYGLYDDRRYTPEAKRTFVGIGGPMLPTPWAEIVNDKPTLTALLAGLGLPVPETQAIVHRERTFAGAHALRDRGDLLRFLRGEARYPVFGKPFDAACSLGTADVSGYTADEDTLFLADGRTVAVEKFADDVEKFASGYLFQTRLRPHPDLVPLVGNRVGTVRMFVLSDDEGCVLLRASWKIAVAANAADNFWRVGNVLAGIDVDSGRVVRAMRRNEKGVAPIAAHPDTGADFGDLVFPHWDEMREVVLRAARNLPGCHFQGWDVALTDRGPVLVELEGDGGDPILEQLCFDTGLLQGRYRKFVEAIPQKLKERKRARRKRRGSSLKRALGQLNRPPGKDGDDGPRARPNVSDAPVEERELVGSAS